jgi:metal-sulfur cluster biosynthetic enzyme
MLDYPAEPDLTSRFRAGYALCVVLSFPIREVQMVTVDQVKKALRKVKDPELNLDLVVLGLIYEVDVQDAVVEVTMSLTSPACPVAGEIVNQAREAVEAIPGVEQANIELTFSPLWTPERIPPMIRSALGL